MNRWKAAVIGLGKIGLMYEFDAKREKPSTHVLAYELNAAIKLIGASDIYLQQKDKLNKIASEVDFYLDSKEMLRKCQPDIVSICTPPKFHLENIKTILNVSKPRIIFCEKPIAHNIEEINELRNIEKNHDVIIVPNISRRWNSGLRKIKYHIANQTYGRLEKIFVRYTRGIYNTGAHLFDLLKWWQDGVRIQNVQVLQKVYTSSEKEKENSYSFLFEMTNGVQGHAEAFNDEQYYMFEIDLYFSKGKVEFRNNGDDIYYYQVGNHHLFTGFKELTLEKHEENLLHESCMKNAVNNIVKVLSLQEQPECKLEDAIYPVYVAEALERSYQSKEKEKVEYRHE